MGPVVRLEPVLTIDGTDEVKAAQGNEYIPSEAPVVGRRLAGGRLLANPSPPTAVT